MNPTNLVQKPDIIFKEIGGETLLYSADEKAVHVLNATARTLWELCDGEHALEDMERAIRAQFSVADEQDVSGDIQRALEALADKGLLEKRADS